MDANEGGPAPAVRTNVPWSRKAVFGRARAVRVGVPRGSLAVGVIHVSGDTVGRGAAGVVAIVGGAGCEAHAATHKPARNKGANRIGVKRTRRARMFRARGV